MNRRSLRILYAALLTLALCFGFSQNVLHQPIHAQEHKPVVALDPSVKFEYGKPIMVAHVVDGDTLQLINGEYVRYVGIDTPEEYDPRKPVQCYALEAAEANRQLVEGKQVVIQKDISTKDKYNRWLGFIYLPNNTFVNEVLVREGFAFAYYYRPDISKAKEFKTAEQQAQQDGLGIWSTCTVYKTSSGREQTNDLK